VSCADGKRGVFTGDAIIWADGTRSNLSSPHPSVIIGNKSSVIVGPGVFVGNGKGGVVPMENPSATRAARCSMVWRTVIRETSFRDGPKDQTRNLEIPGSRFACPGMTAKKSSDTARAIATSEPAIAPAAR
jgi:hypothetical protein